jgi:acetyl-CoA synthetase
VSDFVWEPSEEITESANVTRFMRKHGIARVEDLVRRSIDEQEWFWDAIAEDLEIEFAAPYHTVRDTRRGIPWTDWYVGGKLNLTSNCVDRHRHGPLANQPCLVSEHEDGTHRVLTYSEFANLVDRCAASLRAAGIASGDRVAALMPMTAEVAIQMFATIKIGAIFIPIFSGFAAPAIAERLHDAEAKLLFTAEASSRRGNVLPLRPTFTEVAESVPTLEKIVVLGRGETPPFSRLKREIHWEGFLASGNDQSAAEIVPSMHPALILYTSGTSGQPKGTVHSHAGSLIQIAKEVGYAFDMRSGDRFCWVTDIGWMMGPWMLIGGFFHGATAYLYEGAIDWPEPDRLGEFIEKHRISVLGISPTLARVLRRSGDDVLAGCDLGSLRVLGSTGEPWDEESWLWYFDRLGGRRCPVINISGGTDIIGCFLSPLPLHKLKPCTLAAAGLGMAVEVWNEKGKPVQGEVGYLVCTQPTPSMTRGLWKDAKRYLDTYWRRWVDVWNHGDWAFIDEDGFWFLSGRADDTLNVAGKRIGPAEIEGALIQSGKVSEAAAVGVPDELKGESIVVFAVLRPGVDPSEELKHHLVRTVADRVGKHGRPREIFFVLDLPKTRSAKIVRRVIRNRYLGEGQLGDLSSLQNPEAIDSIPQAS